MGCRSQRERGQGTVEYVGIVLAVVVLVGVLVVAVPGLGRTAACQLERAITQSGGCSEPVTVTYPTKTPASYPTNTPAPQPGPRDSHEADNTAESGLYFNANPGTRTVDQDAVRESLEDIRDALDGGFWGVRSGDLDDAYQAVKRLNGAEIDALVAQMSDDELERWVDQLDDGWLFGGWDSRQRRDLWNLFASRASKDTLDRLARFTDELQPSFDQVGDNPGSPESIGNTGAYGELPHQLFVDGVSSTDVAQGGIGDCWWVASMMAVAQADPSLIERAITVNTNGSYTVRLWRDGEWRHVTVTPDMVLNADGTPAFVHNQSHGTDHELWPMVMEKAMALEYGDFSDIEGGTADVGLTALTGLPSSNTGPGDLSIGELRGVLDEGGAIALSSLSEERSRASSLYQGSDQNPDPLIPGHAYYVSSVDVERGTVTVVNPWGRADYPPRTLTYDEFVSAFRQVRTNEVNR